MRQIAVATSSRSEWSTSSQLVGALAATAGVDVRVLATGTHLEPAWGETVREVEQQSAAPVERLPAFAGVDPAGVAATAGEAAAAFGRSFAERRPDILVVVGDRVELLGITAAALPFGIPIAHVSGGDVTGGAIDDLVRNAVSKLASLHFVAMPEHAERLRRMGEEDWRITVSGDPALDFLRTMEPVSFEELQRDLDASLDRPLAVVGFHPTTLGGDSPEREVAELLAALADFPGSLVITYPGADAGADAIVAALQRFARDRPNVTLRASLGQRRYYGLLAHADVLVGNTSSGIWESPSFRLPTVDVGERQRGRARARNVVHAPLEAGAIHAALEQALEPSFRAGLTGLVNPYGDGHAAARVAEVLASVDLGLRLRAKAPVEV